MTKIGNDAAPWAKMQHWGEGIQTENYPHQHSPACVIVGVQLAMDDPIVLKQGWMKKKGRLHKKWKTRFFVMLSEPSQIRYYHSESSSKALGVINLTNAVAAVDLSQDPKIRRPNAFAIYTARRTFFLSCNSKEEKKQWLKVIGKSVATLQQQARFSSSLPAASSDHHILSQMQKHFEEVAALKRERLKEERRLNDLRKATAAAERKLLSNNKEKVAEEEGETREPAIVSPTCHRTRTWSITINRAEDGVHNVRRVIRVDEQEEKEEEEEKEAQEVVKADDDFESSDEGEGGSDESDSEHSASDGLSPRSLGDLISHETSFPSSSSFVAPQRQQGVGDLLEECLRDAQRTLTAYKTRTAKNTSLSPPSSSSSSLPSSLSSSSSSCPDSSSVYASSASLSGKHWVAVREQGKRVTYELLDALSPSLSIPPPSYSLSSTSSSSFVSAALTSSSSSRIFESSSSSSATSFSLSSCSNEGRLQSVKSAILEAIHQLDSHLTQQRTKANDRLMLFHQHEEEKEGEENTNINISEETERMTELTEQLRLLDLDLVVCSPLGSSGGTTRKTSSPRSSLLGTTRRQQQNSPVPSELSQLAFSL